MSEEIYDYVRLFRLFHRFLQCDSLLFMLIRQVLEAVAASEGQFTAASFACAMAPTHGREALESAIFGLVWALTRVSTLLTLAAPPRLHSLQSQPRPPLDLHARSSRRHLCFRTDNVRDLVGNLARWFRRRHYTMSRRLFPFE